MSANSGAPKIRAGGVEARQARPSLPPNPLDHPAQMAVAERAVWGVLAAGIAGLALGTRHGPVGRLALLALGGGLATLAATGKSPLYDGLKLRQNDSGEILVSQAVTVGRPPEEVYARWRDLSRLPEFMEMLDRVEELHGNVSRWTVNGPTGKLSFEADLIADEPGRRVAWKTRPGSGVQHSGEVTFRPAPGDRGTEVLARYSYAPPGGPAGAAVARILNHEPGQRTKDDLMRFKRLMELGYVPTAKGQTSGRAAQTGRAAQAGPGRSGGRV
ncbi:SRPBCC family protein [Deinococcus sp.]|uniref:SRPBCC family protein n=1 Tax=Deinococcus sp. TaxID=47478 RepID=UPI003C7E4B7C